MTHESYLIYLAALAAFFATPPDTSQLLIRIRRFSPKLVNQSCGAIMIVAAIFLATKNISSG